MFTARLFLNLLLALGWLWSTPAAAQGTVSLASLHVSLWPEYDQPAVLVILDGQLAAGTPLPASLALRVPARAGQPHAVATMGQAGQLLAAAYTTQPAGDDIIILFETPSLGFRVEYYDPALTVDNEARLYTFAWQTDYAIADTAVRVQQPAGARGLTGEPALTAVGVAEDGLSYYQVDLGALEAGATASLRLSYAKTGTTLTSEALAAGAVPAPADPAGPVPQAVTPQADSRGLLLLGAVVVVLGAAGAAWFAHRRGRLTRAAAPAGRGARRARPRAGFCTQCGRGLVAGDRFCRHCGARAAS